MNENSSPASGENNRGPRNQNRGGRRSGNSRGSSRGNRGNDSRQNDGARSQKERSNYGTRDGMRNPAPAKSLTLWQKIVAFFSAKSSTAAAPAPAAPRSIHPTEVRAQQRKEGRPSDNYRRLEHRPTGEEAEIASENAATRDSRDNRDSQEPREARPPREPRVMEKIEVTSPKLYVGNLSFDATESDLSELFNGVGKVRNAEVVSNNYTQKSKGFAFVTMESIDEAKRAVVELHDKDFMGRKLLVSGAKVSERDAA